MLKHALRMEREKQAQKNSRGRYIQIAAMRQILLAVLRSIFFLMITGILIYLSTDGVGMNKTSHLFDTYEYIV